ncbi:hypothetical protein I312_106664 [Cryptococcus bacillisporus CA1280]|uniref:uncharacterized protein n=1 Tax=Cryptococcus bacillisporus CA1280 TaxID=1296109 RepID=UPI003368B30C
MTEFRRTQYEHRLANRHCFISLTASPHASIDSTLIPTRLIFHRLKPEARQSHSAWPLTHCIPYPLRLRSPILHHKPAFPHLSPLLILFRQFRHMNWYDLRQDQTLGGRDAVGTVTRVAILVGGGEELDDQPTTFEPRPKIGVVCAAGPVVFGELDDCPPRLEGIKEELSVLKELMSNLLALESKRNQNREVTGSEEGVARQQQPEVLKDTSTHWSLAKGLGPISPLR